MMAKGRLASARKKLLGLASRWPRSGEVLFRLGQCEEAMGRPASAIDAWCQVPLSDPNFVRAAESRGSLLINQGRFAPAESLLLDALSNAPETSRRLLLRALARLFRLEGRKADVSEVLVASWSHATEPSELLQDLWQNDTEAVPVDGWQVFLDEADQE